MRALVGCLVALFSLALAACAPQAEGLSTPAPPRAKPVWAFLTSDIAADPAFRFSRLPNGMRYVIRRNATPKGTALVRMDIAAASLDESDAERGFAHFVEHMAFNGSTRVPEGEMVRLLERNGLAFGADTNASTGFEQTLYTLDLPRADPALLDTALMLMRETASELTFAPEAVARERGVVLAELRDRNSYQLRNLEDQLAFAYPGARYAARLPIGTPATLNAATADTLKAFWRREYVSAHTTLIVVGDFDAATVEAAITAKFSDWRPVPAAPQPDAGPVDPKSKGRADVYVDPALSERVTASRNGPWLDEPDSAAQRRENLLRQIGYAIVNRRLLRTTRQANPPFRGAGLGTSDVFEAGRTTNLVVDTVDGKWRRGLIAAARDYQRALARGFTAAEVAEQVAIIRTSARNEVASANTRSNGALVGAVLALIRNELVPSTPQASLARLEAFIPEITPERVLAALKREAVTLDDPLLRFQGRTQPAGGATAIRAAWDEAMRRPLGETTAATAQGFGYTEFGPPGTVASDTREAALGIREVRFANGVRLNLKRTDLEAGRVQVQLSLDGGELLDTRTAPLTTEMSATLPGGGLGKHSQDELQSLLAGRTVGAGFSPTPETFVASAQTTPADLELQLQLLAAFVTDPGYRPEGEVQYRLSINNFFAQLRATPGAALSNRIGGILSDDDPRFTLQPQGAYRDLTFARLKADLADRLAKGAIEIGIVGDIDEDAAIALVGKTFGALAPREADFRPYTENRVRKFTADRTPKIIRHTGPKDQAIVQLTWPTRDARDPVADLTLDLLQRVVQLELTETLREKLGKAYSPGARSNTTFTWPNYGTFSISASVDVHEVATTRVAMLETVAELRDKPITPDLLLRARQPVLESYDNALKSNRGWLSLVDRAQTEADRIDRFVKFRERLAALTAADVEAAARRYLTPGGAVEITVLPEGA